MSGLFVQKHVEAVRAQGVDVRVIHSEGWLDLWHQWRALQREGWTPDVVQLNVIQKQGLLALWLKRRYHIPYVIIEHWSGYLPENGQFMQFSSFKKRLYKYIAEQAEMILTVSQRHAEAMKECGIRNKHWDRINNVVDDFFFEKPKTTKKKSAKKTLLNITCFDERAKNVKGLLRAAKALSEKRQDWQLVLVGTGIDYQAVRSYADSLNFPEGLLLWTGEITPQEVAEWLHKSDAFVLSSRYETYGVVLAEAAAAGVPILSTPVGIAEDIANLIVPQDIAQHHPQRFAEFIETILWSNQDNPKSPDLQSRFSAPSIGHQLKNIYEQCMVSE
ncbi:MAG: glycosyltransferase [Paludibacteraceae bacterium]|nr:glycosyltransferase [Paludibacteraceae bacterium]